MKRSIAEKLFLLFFFPTVIGFYLIYKYPTWFVAEDQVVSTFYLFNKSTGFWYATIYSAIVCFLSFRVFIKGKAPYSKNKRAPISNYQRNKFISIFLSQLIFFYFIPYILPYVFQSRDFFADKYAPINKDAYVYVYNGFTSLGGFLYIFILIPVLVWFFGKKYCSWFCACGNLAETIGITKWGNAWVTKMTPRGKFSQKLEVIQYIFLFFALCFGFLLLFDTWKIFSAGDLLSSWRFIQDLVIDLIFGALIGVGAYPILGTRIWCRYGCPLAGGMRLFGKFAKSKFKISINENCKGLDLCTPQCPMGIDVASYAHQNKVPLKGSFSLDDTTCIGCGGCIDVCPVKAIKFEEIMLGKKQVQSA